MGLSRELKNAARRSGTSGGGEVLSLDAALWREDALSGFILVTPDQLLIGENVRGDYTEEGLQNLSGAISEERAAGGGIAGTGFTHALTVTRTGKRNDAGRLLYQVEIGKGRALAAERLAAGGHIGRVPVYVKSQAANDVQRVFTQLRENTYEGINAKDEAAAFQVLRDNGWKDEDIARHIGRGLKYLEKRRGLEAAPPDVSRILRDRPAIVTVARPLMKLPPAKRAPLIKRLELGEGVAAVAKAVQSEIKKQQEAAAAHREPEAQAGAAAAAVAVTHSAQRDEIQAELRALGSDLARLNKRLAAVVEKQAALIRDGGSFGTLYRKDLADNATVIDRQYAGIERTAGQGRALVQTLAYHADVEIEQEEMKRAA